MTLLDVSFALLCVFMAAQTLTLNALLESAGQFLERIETAPPDIIDATAAIGMRVPTLAFRSLDNRSTLTERDLLGRTTMILFLTVSDACALGDAAVSSIIHGLAGQCEERLNIVVEGGEADCAWLRDRFGLAQFDRQMVLLLATNNSAIRQHLGLKTTPCCVVFDEDGRVRKVGTPLLDGHQQTNMRIGDDSSTSII